MRNSIKLRLPLLAFLCAAFFAPLAHADEDTSPVAALRAYEDQQDETAPAAPVAATTVPDPETTASLAPGVGAVAAARHKVLPLIEKAAQEHQLPPALLEAVVRIESRFNPNARNAGAIGLMQIKLATARGIGFTGDATALAKPETNLHWGAKYLARAYRLSNGDTCMTLARYQGGHRVEKMGPAGKAYCAKVRTVLAQRG
jgi:soluble lytic murein transglycosylase-like protein